MAIGAIAVQYGADGYQPKAKDNWREIRLTRGPHTACHDPRESERRRNGKNDYISAATDACSAATGARSAAANVCSAATNGRNATRCQIIMPSNVTCLNCLNFVTAFLDSDDYRREYRSYANITSSSPHCRALILIAPTVDSRTVHLLRDNPFQPCASSQKLHSNLSGCGVNKKKKKKKYSTLKNKMGEFKMAEWLSVFKA
ncbi:hypothetical protein G5I_03373 [Acromyrmex echinatior]|uniref:Uncharacterized protein n=1 Tax=Acromyrmex echinatior TaxID=103372 RepID=F4WCU0_ACREC|nr:hypothetical protein G5I_03373 [Acromyrmex echinatior]